MASRKVAVKTAPARRSVPHRPVAPVVEAEKAPKERKQAPVVPKQGAVVPGSAIGGRLAANVATGGIGAAEPADPADEPKVRVNIPHDFKLQGNDRIIYQYLAGNGVMMPKSHAEHSYSAANGVKKVKGE